MTARFPAVSRRVLAGAALGAGALALAAAIVSGGGEGGDAAAREPGVPTVELERRDLVARESVEGTLGYAGESEVVNRLAGTITWLPPEGEVVTRGERLFGLDGEPVLLMYGRVPAYRELAAGVPDGPDVRQLEANLAELGFTAAGSMTVDDEFTAATATAVSDLQESLDLEQTGSVELGRVVFQAGARRVTSLNAALGADAGSSAGGATGASAATESGGRTLASYVSDAPPTSVDPEPGTQPEKGGDEGGGGKDEKGKGDEGGSPAPAVPQASGAAAAQPDDGSDSGSGGVSTEVMTTTSERRVVTVELDPADSDLARRGSPARVELPGGEQVKGRVAAVGTVAQADESEAEGESSDPTIEVTISLPEGRNVTGLDQAPVTVELTDEVRRDVLAVPVEALLGTAGDGYAVVITDADGRRQVPVEPGLFADGYVEIEGDGLREGAAVEVPGE